MSRVERLFSLFILGIMILSIPTFFSEIIPRPYNWVIKLVSLGLKVILLSLPLVILFKENKGFKYYLMASILLIPQGLSDSGILHKKIPDFILYESAFDWSITGIILVLYVISFIYLLKSLRSKKWKQQK